MPESVYVLGINSAYHESSAALLRNGEIVAFAEEERFTRVKHAKPARVDNADVLPVEAMAYCLREAGIGWDDLTHIGWSLEPTARRDRNAAFVSPYPLEPGNWGTPEGESTFFDACKRVPERLSELAGVNLREKFRFLPHHLCHAASAFLASPFTQANILVVDGIAEFASTWMGFGRERSLEKVREIEYPNSLGFLWEKFSKYLGFSEYDACKVMGLATCGRFYIPRYVERHFGDLIRLHKNGTFSMDDAIARVRSEDYSCLEDLFFKEQRDKKLDPTPTIQELVIAQALQKRTEETLVHMVRYLVGQSGCRKLCMAGGVALNSVANSRIRQVFPDLELFVQPAAHDAGTALGAALYIWHVQLGQPRPAEGGRFRHAYLGPGYDDDAIGAALDAAGLPHEHVADEEELVRRTAGFLAENQIIGWFQGRMEVGPRALGNRSILAHPTDGTLRERLNSKGIKDREQFRPLAPSVLEEEIEGWFEDVHPSPYMLEVFELKKERQGSVDAVVHYDLTSRIQTVTEEQNARYHRLIRAFQGQTGIPMVLNTSFNSQEPIVCSPQDAIRTFQGTGLDHLVMGNFIATHASRS